VLVVATVARLCVVPAVLGAGSAGSGWANVAVVFAVRRVQVLGFVPSRLVGRPGISAPGHEGSSRVLVTE